MNTTPNTPQVEHIEPICAASKMSNAISCCDSDEDLEGVIRAFSPLSAAHGWCGPKSASEGPMFFIGFADNSCILLDFTGERFCGSAASESVMGLIEGALGDPEVPARIKTTVALIAVTALRAEAAEAADTQPEADLQPGKAKG